MAELEQAFPGVETRLIPSSGGVFDVAVNGNVVFSKKAAGRHARPGEVVNLIQSMPT